MIDEEKRNKKGMGGKVLAASACLVVSCLMARIAVVNNAPDVVNNTSNTAQTDVSKISLVKNDMQPQSRTNLDVSDIAEAAMPSVVSITTKSVLEVQSYFDMFGYGYFTPQQQEVEGSGSGIIIGSNNGELLVATNYHVVQGATNLSVAFVDGKACEAVLKGFDDDKDLAVVSVKINDIEEDTKKSIKVAVIGDSNSIKVGEQVVAIGNALGYGQSVTTGIVSAKNRNLDTEMNLIQTDTAINPGNSGGALLNMDGQVIGINSAKLASTEVEGMCYAIAITDVEDVLENLMNEETRDKVEDHGVLGISGSTVGQDITEMYGVPAGVYIAEVNKDSAAEKAGLKKQDIITKFCGKSVTTIEQLVEYLNYYKPDEVVELTVQVKNESGGYEEKVVEVALEKKDGKKEEEGNLTKDDGGEDEQYGIGGDSNGIGGGSGIFDNWNNGFFNQWGW